MTDWARQIGERKRLERQRAAIAAQEAKEKETRDRITYERLVEAFFRAVTDEAEARARDYALASGDELSINRNPRGGISIDKGRYPAGSIGIGLDREGRALVARSHFMKHQADLQTAPERVVQIQVSADGESLVLHDQGTDVTPAQFVASILGPFFERI